LARTRGHVQADTKKRAAWSAKGDSRPPASRGRVAREPKFGIRGATGSSRGITPPGTSKTRAWRRAKAWGDSASMSSDLYYRHRVSIPGHAMRRPSARGRSSSKAGQKVRLPSGPVGGPDPKDLQRRQQGSIRSPAVARPSTRCGTPRFRGRRGSAACASSGIGHWSVQPGSARGFLSWGGTGPRSRKVRGTSPPKRTIGGSSPEGSRRGTSRKKTSRSSAPDRRRGPRQGRDCGPARLAWCSTAGECKSWQITATQAAGKYLEKRKRPRRRDRVHAEGAGRGSKTRFAPKGPAAARAALISGDDGSVVG